ncbi:MAG: methyltransferase domain-containing protein [Spirochaetales bacterium]|nr:methyltransferase domain-containing protein [Spirochaetales bacterium]
MCLAERMNAEEKMRSHYYPRLEEFEETHKILDWESREAQFARFRVLTENIDIANKSLLDVGCGCGDLFQMLKEDGIDVNYLGVDILPAMVEKASELHKDGQFLCVDLFKDKSFCTRTFNLVFTSGIFNLNLNNNMEFFQSALIKFSEIADEYLVINLLDEGSPDRDDNYFYFNPENAAAMVQGHGWDVEIVRGYLSNDFTLIGKNNPDTD